MCAWASRNAAGVVWTECEPRTRSYGVRDGRAEDEFRVGPRLELDRLARRLESRQIAVP